MSVLTSGFACAATGGAPRRRWGRTRFRHPETGRQILYTETYRRHGQLLSSTFHYQPVDGRGRPQGAERRAVLRHRLLAPAEVRALLARAGLDLIATWGGFDGRPLPEPGRENSARPAPGSDEWEGETEQQIFLARLASR